VGLLIDFIELAGMMSERCEVLAGLSW